MKKVKGFTLIELLIVVAIIGILAAIAIPNFLNAQTRSKVARAEAEMRQVATALETYYIDNNVYPPPYDLSDWRDTPGVMQNLNADGYFEGGEASMTSPRLTTPVQHLSALPTDPFDANGKAPYKYTTRYLSCWIMSSFGPDNTRSLETGADSETDYVDSTGTVGACDTRLWRQTYEAMEGIIYDPTNGTTSPGDIVRTGP
jgi:prepilin-type N-terminal cleavage/methylation domain-containing protein